MTILRSDVSRCLFWLASIGAVAPLACGAARLDPNTKAVTFDTPDLVASAEPSHKPVASPAPSTAASTSMIGAPLSAAVQVGPRVAEGQANAPSSTPQRQQCSRLPDPKPSLTDDWRLLTIEFENGKLSLISEKPERTRRAESSARRMGRFEAELWIGCELIDRIRFDFPLLAGQAPSKDAVAQHRPDFETHGRFVTTVMVPNSERATRLELRDRAEEAEAKSVVALDWPLQLQANKPAKSPPNPAR